MQRRRRCRQQQQLLTLTATDLLYLLPCLCNGVAFLRSRVPAEPVGDRRCLLDLLHVHSCCRACFHAHTQLCLLLFVLERISTTGGPVASTPTAGPTAFQSHVLILCLLLDLIARRTYCSPLTSSAEVWHLLIVVLLGLSRPTLSYTYCSTCCWNITQTMIYACTIFDVGRFAICGEIARIYRSPTG